MKYGELLKQLKKEKDRIKIRKILKQMSKIIPIDRKI